MVKIEKYALLIYSTHTTACIYHREWNKQPDTVSKENAERLIFGLLFSLRRTASKFSPKGTQAQLTNFRTSGYKLHFYQTVGGYSFILLSSANAPSLHEKLKQFYQQVFFPLVVVNPLYTLNEPIHLPVFEDAVEKFNFEL